MGLHDDFLVSQGVDTTVPCNNDGQIWDGDIVLPVGAAISSVCYIYLLWMYFVLNTPVLKRHPTTLAIYKCIFEFAFIQQYLWTPFLTTNQFYDDDALEAGIPPYYCNASNLAAYLSFLTQFTLLGSELCFLVISLDLRMAYTNPFSSYKQNRWYFASIVFGISFVTAVALMTMGDQVYGLSSLGIAWIQDRREARSPSYAKMLLFYIILIAIFIYCLWANFQFNKNDLKGFSKTVSNRISIMRRSKKFTVGYVVFGAIVLLIEFVSYLADTNQTAVGPVPAYFYCYRGVWALVVILYSNWTELSWKQMNPFRLKDPEASIAENVAQEGLLLQPHLNTALRAEILYFTTQGIMYAARAYDLQLSRKSVDKKGSAEPDPQQQSSAQELEDEQRESRMYSFDEQFTGGIRPSFMEENGIRSVQTQQKQKRPSGILGRRGSNLAKNGNNSVPGAAGANDTDLEAQSQPQECLSETISLTRDTLTEIDRLEKQQTDKMNEERELALEEELESLGLSRHSLGKLLSKSPTTAATPEQTKSGVPAAQTKPAKIVNDSAGQSSFHPVSINGEARNGAVRSPMFVSNNSVEMRSSMGRLSSLSNTSHTGSDASDTTVKWRDTMDIEFSMRQSVENKKGQQPGGDDLPRWHRVDSVGSTGSARIGSQESNQSNTTSERIKKSLQNAIINAKSVFSAAYYDFRFKDFCPKLFAKVRAMCNLEPVEYARSFETTCKERFSEGRSGAFMFFSSDQRSIVKTCTKSELMALHAMMPKYVAHLENNPNSLIVRFLGAHCITMYGVELYFVIMLNFFPTFPLSERYDLKGSWVNRHGPVDNRKSRNDRGRKDIPGNPPLYQDNDLQHKISMQPEVVNLLAEQIKRDINFMKNLNFMDYSLLIGVKRERFTVIDKKTGAAPCDVRASSVEPEHSTAEETAAEGGAAKSWTVFGNGIDDLFKRDIDGGMRARIVEGPGTYYIGIIDILQEWNFKKRSERFFKMYFKFLDGDGLSAMSPHLYADRFWKRCVVDTFEGIEFDDNYINVRTEDREATGQNSSIYGSRNSAGNSLRSTKVVGEGNSEAEQFVELHDE